MRPSRKPVVLRWIARVLLVAAAAITLMMVVLAVAMLRDDADIDAHLAKATATVLAVSPLHTGIEFVDSTGATIRPPGGVLYPGLLSVGEHFIVEYSTVNPELVRVAGRTAAVGAVMVLAVLAVTWAIAGPLIWWLRRRSGQALLGRG